MVSARGGGYLGGGEGGGGGREVLLGRAAIDFVDPSDRFPIDRQEAELARHDGR